MTKDAALANANTFYVNGEYERTLQRRVAIQTESQSAEKADLLHFYLQQEMQPAFERMGFVCQIMDNPIAGRPPLLFAERHEDSHALTLLKYGHGDVVRGYDVQWGALNPWQLTARDDKWYGRGTADNKGQHSINLAALEFVINARQGKLGYNVKYLIEMGEEIGSPGLDEFCAQHAAMLNADLFIASDGPRLSAEQPTIFLGSRGLVLFELAVNLRESGLHSGNWGGIMRNPAVILANAISSLIDQNGHIKVNSLLPPTSSPAVKAALDKLLISDALMGRSIDVTWGETGLSSAEKLFGWNALEVLALIAGNPANPVNAIPPSAKAYCQLRFVVGTAWEACEKILRQHLDKHGFDCVDIHVQRGTPATRLAPDNQWVTWAQKSMSATLNKPVAILPNLGGTLPNHVFANTLGLPTLWIPHSYPGCSQHAANEHIPQFIVQQGLQLMTALLWDLGEVNFKKILPTA